MKRAVFLCLLVFLLLGGAGEEKVDEAKILNEKVLYVARCFVGAARYYLLSRGELPGSSGELVSVLDYYPNNPFTGKPVRVHGNSDFPLGDVGWWREDGGWVLGFYLPKSEVVEFLSRVDERLSVLGEEGKFLKVALRMREVPLPFARERAKMFRTSLLSEEERDRLFWFFYQVYLRMRCAIACKDAGWKGEFSEFSLKVDRDGEWLSPSELKYEVGYTESPSHKRYYAVFAYLEMGYLGCGKRVGVVLLRRTPNRIFRLFSLGDEPYDVYLFPQRDFPVTFVGDSEPLTAWGYGYGGARKATVYLGTRVNYSWKEIARTFSEPRTNVTAMWFQAVSSFPDLVERTTPIYLDWMERAGELSFPYYHIALGGMSDPFFPRGYAERMAAVYEKFVEDDPVNWLPYVPLRFFLSHGWNDLARRVFRAYVTSLLFSLDYDVPVEYLRKSEALLSADARIGREKVVVVEVEDPEGVLDFEKGVYVGLSCADPRVDGEGKVYWGFTARTVYGRVSLGEGRRKATYVFSGVKPEELMVFVAGRTRGEAVLLSETVPEKDGRGVWRVVVRVGKSGLRLKYSAENRLYTWESVKGADEYKIYYLKKNVYGWNCVERKEPRFERPEGMVGAPVVVALDRNGRVIATSMFLSNTPVIRYEFGGDGNVGKGAERSD